MALTCDVNLQLQDEHDPLLKHRTNNNNNDPLENMQFQPVDGDGDGDCSSLGDLSSVVPQGKPSHSFHMIARDSDGSRPCGVTRNEFAYQLGTNAYLLKERHRAVGNRGFAPALREGCSTGSGL